jgi:hypothetical protein
MSWYRGSQLVKSLSERLQLLTNGLRLGLEGRESVIRGGELVRIDHVPHEKSVFSGLG